MHDERSVNAMLAFAQDFKPHVWIEGGDQLDLGAISHHNKENQLSIEGLRIDRDAEAYRTQVLNVIEKEIDPETLVWMEGNHEYWLHMLLEKNPGLEGFVSFDNLLDLSYNGWQSVGQGGEVRLGKLSFVHGDRISGGADNKAKAGVLNYHRNIRFGHFHTYQSYTMHSPVDATLTKTGISVPALTKRNPAYGRNTANKWAIGFNYGYVFEDQTYTDYTPIIINGRFATNGKVYRG